MLLKMKDGGIKNIRSDRDYEKGYCDTCEFGSLYVSLFEIVLSKYRIVIKASLDYCFPLSEGHLMKIMLNNVDVIKKMTEEDFALWLKLEFQKEVDTEIDYKIYGSK